VIGDTAAHGPQHGNHAWGNRPKRRKRKMTIHQDLTSNAALQARIRELEAKLATKSKGRALSLKVTEPKLVDGEWKGTKGAISLYGINGKFPVTLYKNQWVKLRDFMPEIMAFIEENAADLTEKE
jgi:hypothetical protein